MESQDSGPSWARVVGRACCVLFHSDVEEGLPVADGGRQENEEPDTVGLSRIAVQIVSA